MRFEGNIEQGMIEKVLHNRFYLQNTSADPNSSGRHALLITPNAHASPTYSTPHLTTTFKQTLRGILLMFTRFPYWDISYLVAIIFTIGSVLWCINAFFVWLPLKVPSSEFEGEIANAGGITAFIGATIFEIGSVFLMLEAVNEKQEGCFGWAVENVLEEKGLVRVRKGECMHHHGNRGNLVGKAKGAGGVADTKIPERQSNRNWTWLPTWHELRTHYFREVGFLACLSQMIGQLWLFDKTGRADLVC
jgi:hypothetical protein